MKQRNLVASQLSFKNDWEDFKDEVMRKALYAKFSQNREIKEIPLLSIHAQDLVEETTDDYYWGRVTDGSENKRLGILLVELRNK